MKLSRLNFLFSLVTLVILPGACHKTTVPGEDLLIGTWIREGTDGNGPGNTLHFSKSGSSYQLKFNCSGSPGAGWPTTAQTEYKFLDGKLIYSNYADPNGGFYMIDHFRWIKPGKEFEAWFNEILLYMSATYPVRYRKLVP